MKSRRLAELVEDMREIIRDLRKIRTEYISDPNVRHTLMKADSQLLHAISALQSLDGLIPEDAFADLE